MPAISVVIPIYNAEKYLRRCLDSLLNQTFTDWEAICVNDGSPDNSLDILKEYAKKDKRFVVLDKKNGGVSDARNAGLKIANGDYIHFLDADDFIDDDYYENMLNTALDNKADMVCSGFVTDNKYAKNISYKKVRVLTSMRQKLLYTFAFTDSFIWRYLFKRTFLNNNNLVFDTNFVAQEDTIFLLHALEKVSKIVVVPFVSYHYMFNDMSALNNRDKAHHEKVKRQYKVAKQIKKDFAKKNHLVCLWKFRKFIALFKRSL